MPMAESNEIPINRGAEETEAATCRCPTPEPMAPIGAGEVEIGGTVFSVPDSANSVGWMRRRCRVCGGSIAS